MPHPTGMRDVLHRGRRGLERAKKGLEKAKWKSPLAMDPGSVEARLDRNKSLQEIRDEHGFTVRPELLETYRIYEDVYKEEEKHREIKWKQFLSTYRSFGSSEGDNDDAFEPDDWNWRGLCAVEQASVRRRKKELMMDDFESEDRVPDGQNYDVFTVELTKIVRLGVPKHLRGEVWQYFVGVNERWVEGEYHELLGTRETKVAKPTLEKWASQIEKDLPRTFPGNPKLGDSKLDSLRCILTAYARHNPEVGYCQAMNFLAALILFFMPEENAFWTLTSIIDDYFEGYYTERMTEAQVDQLVFVDVMRLHFPKLADHLDAVEVEISWFSSAWFLSIFVNVLPWESVLRVWDVLLYEGNRSMLFRTALALLERHAEALVQESDNGAVLLKLQSMGETTFDSTNLVWSACHGFLTVNEELLQPLRERHRPAVIAALNKRSLDTRKWRTAQLDATNGSLSAVDLPNTALPLTTVDEEGSTLEFQLSGEKCLINATDEEKSDWESQFSPPSCLNSREDDERKTFKPKFSGLNKGSNNNEVEQRSTLSYELSAPKFFPLESPLSNQKRFLGGPISRIDETDKYQETDEFQESVEYQETESFDLRKEVSRLRKELDREIQAREEAEWRAEAFKSALNDIENSDRKFSAQVKELEKQIAHLKKILDEKHEQEVATVQDLLRLEQETRKAEEARQRAIEEAEESRHIANKAIRGAAEDLERMEKRALLAESMLEAIEKQASEELRVMEKRAVMAESMLEATLDFHAGAVPRTKRGIVPMSKGDESKDSSRFHNHTHSKQDGDSALEKRQNASKIEEAEKFTANRMNIFGRPFPLRDKNKIHAEHEEYKTHNLGDQNLGDSASVSLNSSPALTRKMGNIQHNSTPELVKLQCIKRRL